MTVPEHPVEEDAPSHYEKSQPPGRGLFVAAVAFFAFLGVLFIVTWELLAGWSRQPAPEWEHPVAPSAEKRWNLQAPQLQTDPAADLARVRAAEDRNLHSRHWNDASHTYATIPIEDAMNLLARAAASHQLGAVLPPPRPASPLDLQNQKSTGAAPAPPASPTP